MEGYPIHVKPSLYAEYFYTLKEIARRYGYNLVIHGSMSRDLDLIAIPWQEKTKPHLKMVKRFAKVLGGTILMAGKKEHCSVMHKGRLAYVIDIHRYGKYVKGKPVKDMQYYLDISVITL